MRSVVCLVLLVAVVGAVEAANKNRIGTAGAQELLVPVGARGIAIGPSSMVFAPGAEGIYWNPAGLSRMTRGVEAMASWMSYIADINVSYGAIGIEAGDFGHVGFTLKNVGFGDIPVTTEDFPDGTGEMFSPTYLTIGVTYSKLLTDRISVGLTGNIVSERIQGLSATGFALNIGLQYFNLGVNGLNLGVAVKNVGPSMQFDGSDLLVKGTASDATTRGEQFYQVVSAAFEMPSSMEIGLSYKLPFDEANNLQLGGVFRNNNYQEDEWNLGGEYVFNNLLFLRGGYTFSPQTDNDPTGERGYIYDYTVGAGVQSDVGGMLIGFDYAYRHAKYFDGNHVITVLLGF
jgi:hypothetical protein